MKHVMPDMLVNLRNLPKSSLVEGVEIRRANSWDKHFLREWVKTVFGLGWAQCCDAALEQRPVTCFVAVIPGCEGPTYDGLIGFAIYDVSARGVFGPMGVREDYRKNGIGALLTVETLSAMHKEGYAYTVIGQVGPANFYAKTVGATLIEGSDPGSARSFLI